MVTELPLDLRFRTKGELAIDIRAGAFGDGLSFDFVCGDEVYSCTALREFLEERGQAYVLRVASTFILTLDHQKQRSVTYRIREATGRGRSLDR